MARRLHHGAQRRSLNSLKEKKHMPAKVVKTLNTKTLDPGQTKKSKAR